MLINVLVQWMCADLDLQSHVYFDFFLSLLVHILKVNRLASQSNQEPAGSVSYLNASWAELAGINSK